MFHVKRPRALLINPFIYDFSAYSVWSSPLGLLYLGAILRRNGFKLDLIDCMAVDEPKRRSDGRAPFLKEQVPKPFILQTIKKRYRRYGISPTALTERLLCLEPPDVILVTSIMTYWYTGAREVVEVARRVFPQSSIVLGGIYPSLCSAHAYNTIKAADLLVTSPGLNRFYTFLDHTFNTTLLFRPKAYDLETLPYPCHDLYDHIPFVPILTSLGCTYHCTYCATPYLYPHITRRQWQSTLTEILYWQNRGVNKFVLYDDNFLYAKERYALPLLEALAGLPRPIYLYNPNALNAALVDRHSALLLRKAGFTDIRLGLETINPTTQRSTGGKVNRAIFESAVQSLRAAGYQGKTISAYVLAGLPFQSHHEILTTIDYLTSLSVKAHIAEYTPIPHTPLFEQYKDQARYPIATEPLFQNNALFPFAWEGFTEQDLQEIKHRARHQQSDYLQAGAISLTSSLP